MSVEFRLLGSVVAYRDGAPLPLGSAKQLGVLVALLWDVNSPVSVDDLVWRVWGERVPRQARNSLHSYFSRLRSVLAGEAEIERRGLGYELRVDRLSVDVHRFRAVAAEARARGRADDAALLFDEALGLWRGEPFPALESPWFDEARAALRTERESALLDRGDLLLELGRHARLAAELVAWADQRPWDERTAGQLMLALYRDGRRADALVRFQKVRAALADELGVGPGARLRALHEAILREDPALTAPLGGSAGQAAAGEQELGEAPVVPRQLTAAPRSFVARETELETLSDILASGDGKAPPVSIIAGPGGVGKTYLALQWAYQHLGDFPDGQLFVDLRGFEPSVETQSPYDAMRSLLAGLGLSPKVIPADQESLIGLYRSVLADRRLLLVIDNAAAVEQVVPLLPGAAGCSVIVTSRHRLMSLVTTHDAALLALDVFDEDDARQLLSARLGERRLAVEPDAVGKLLAACGGLPLALTLAVGRALEHPEFPLTVLATELSDAGSALSALEADGSVGVRAVLATSYAALTAEQAAAFRLLGLIPGPDIGLAAAASLIGQPDGVTRSMLLALERCSLVQQQRPGRFRMHDLVRAYAREEAERCLAAAMRESALHRLTSFYLHTVVQASALIQPDRPDTPLEFPPPDGCRPLRLSDADEALAWFDAEVENVVAGQRTAEQRSWHEMVWQFALAAQQFFTHVGHEYHGISTLDGAVVAARALGDDRTLAFVHAAIAVAATRAGNQDAAHDHARSAVSAAERTGDVASTMFALLSLAEAHWRTGQIELAVATSTRAWRLNDGQPPLVRARTAGTHAWFLTLDGQYDAAREMAELSMDLYGRLGNQRRTNALVNTLGYIARMTGEPEKAIGYFERSLSLSSAISDFFAFADTHAYLAQTYVELGRPDDARRHLEIALAHYERQHRAEDVRATRTALDALTG